MYAHNVCTKYPNESHGDSFVCRYNVRMYVHVVGNGEIISLHSQLQKCESTGEKNFEVCVCVRERIIYETNDANRLASLINVAERAESLGASSNYIKQKTEKATTNYLRAMNADFIADIVPS